LVITTPQNCNKSYKQNNIKDKFIYKENSLTKKYNYPYNPFSKNDIHGIKWGSIFIDEIQDYLNYKCLTFCSIASLASYQKWGLTGTLFQNPNVEKLFGYYLLFDEKSPRDYKTFKLYIKEKILKDIKETLIIRERKEIEIEVEEKIIRNKLNEFEKFYYDICSENLDKLIKSLDMLEGKNKNKQRMNILGIISHIRQGLVEPMIPISLFYINNANKDIIQKLKENPKYHQFVKNYNYTSSRILKLKEILLKHNNENIIIFSNYNSILSYVDYFCEKNN